MVPMDNTDVYTYVSIISRLQPVYPWYTQTVCVKLNPNSSLLLVKPIIFCWLISNSSLKFANEKKTSINPIRIQ